MLKSFVFFACLFQIALAHAQALRIAVAANAQFVIKALQADFQKNTGIETEAITGSSGNLSNQIKNGAPFDVFLSADMDFPIKLFNEKFAITEPKVYALGSLIICTTAQYDLKNWPLLISKEEVLKIAIANPALAPYGKAAEQAMQHHRLWDKLRYKFVFGESISQVNTYITTGVANIGFTTEALIYEYAGKNKLYWARVDKSLYEKIRQGVVVLAYAKKGNFDKAMKFYNYLFTAPAKQIFRHYGYQVL